MMHVAWRFRIMIFAVLALLLFGDFYGYASVKGVKSDPNQAVTPSGAGKFQQKNAEIEISEESEFNGLPTDTLKVKKNHVYSQLTDTIKESCLPKMLCELASKSEYTLTEKEKELLKLIRSPTMPWMMNIPPSKWYFAAHMGELLRYTGDNLSGPMGCANLWPNCPISSKKLMKLSYKVKV